jgi:signal transduction histidine kinase
MSLRFRLALAIASVAALVTAGVGLVVFDRERSDRINRARLSAAIIVEAEARIQNRSEFRPDLAIEGGGAPDDPRIPDELRRRVAEGRTAHVLADVDGETFVIAGTPLSRQTGERIYHFRSFESEEAALAGLRLTLLRVGIAATALGGLMGVLVASILARPLVRSAALARRLAAGDLDARLNLRGSDEVAELGRALDDMAEALGTKIRELDEAAAREQRFSADVAHELRTPITGIVAASSLLDDSPAATMVRQRARTMASLVEDLLEVMRLESVRPDDVRRTRSTWSASWPTWSRSERRTRSSRRPTASRSSRTRGGWSGSWPTCSTTPCGTARRRSTSPWAPTARSPCATTGRASATSSTVPETASPWPTARGRAAPASVSRSRVARPPSSAANCSCATTGVPSPRCASL